MAYKLLSELDDNALDILTERLYSCCFKLEYYLYSQSLFPQGDNPEKPYIFTFLIMGNECGRKHATNENIR